jgi:hypothetical protein
MLDNAAMTTMRLLAILILAAATDARAVDVDCFATRLEAAAYVADDGLALQALPEAQAPRIASTAFGDEVCVLRTQEAQGQAWTLVRTSGKYKRPGRPAEQGEGWVRASGLVRARELAPLRVMRVQAVEVDIGDSAVNYAIDGRGRYAVRTVIGEHACRAGEHPDEYGACNDSALVRGRLLGARGLVLADRTADLFRLMPDGRLCPQRGAEPPAGCPARR